MNDKKRNKELLHRRDFFKKATKTVLPVMAAIAMPSFLMSCSKSSDDYWGDEDNGNDDSENGNSGGGSGNNGSGNDSGNVGNVSISSADGTINGYGYVDLGLSIKWATCNYGASSPEGYGTRCQGIKGTIGNLKSAGYWGDAVISGTSFDRITEAWGTKWRTPSKHHFEELLNSCNVKLFTYNNVSGLLFISKKNKKSIFLPFAGTRYKYNGSWETGYSRGKGAEYWTGDIHVSAGGADAYVLCIQENGKERRLYLNDVLDNERSLRAVTDGISQTGCNNSCANNSTNSGCSNCASSCSSGCKASCDYNCAATCKSHCYGSCNDTCGGGCKAASKGTSCSGCARTCNNRCYQTCSYACSSNCQSSCVNGAK